MRRLGPRTRGPGLRLRRGFRGGLRDRFAERPEHELDVFAGLRRAEEIRRLEGLRSLFHLLLTERRLVLQVHLVDRKCDRDLADGPEHGLDPRIEVLPTACSPTRQTFTFIRRGSIMSVLGGISRKSFDDLRYSLGSI